MTPPLLPVVLLIVPPGTMSAPPDLTIWVPPETAVPIAVPPISTGRHTADDRGPVRYAVIQLGATRDTGADIGSGERQ